jgi:hypothetical protein
LERVGFQPLGAKPEACLVIYRDEAEEEMFGCED